MRGYREPSSADVKKGGYEPAVTGKKRGQGFPQEKLGIHVITPYTNGGKT